MVPACLSVRSRARARHVQQLDVEGRNAAAEPLARRVVGRSFSVRGLNLLADSWERNPPFPNDYRYGQALRNYRRDLIEKYRKAGGPQPVEDLAGWVQANRALLDGTNGLAVHEEPAILAVVKEMESDQRCVEDLGAVNRWPQRSAVPLEEYLRLWRASCSEIGASGRLPARLQKIFGLRVEGAQQ